MSQFLYKPWIKKEMLNYLNDYNQTNDINETLKKSVRAQVLKVSTIRLEADNLQKPCAKIHDNEFYIHCFFSEECIQKFESEANSQITSIKGFLIIISEFSFRFIKDPSIKSPGYDCFLNIEKFKYSTNFTDDPELDLECFDRQGSTEITKIGPYETRYKKITPFSSYPGWRGWATNYYNMNWRRVPLEQRKILDALPGWESDKTGISESENINNRNFNAITSENSEELTTNTEMSSKKA
ncbi:5345_t:CDS:2 [Gigaspora margarita]|uniref:5345_t:CDS:1 n=1 Tax=Gigaspora margarita TaxID=4874 RepID=A0ABN7UHW5_GIGMA|nr:5345_t:CDS:2 [Gigaspora margarita]